MVQNGGAKAQNQSKYINTECRENSIYKVFLFYTVNSANNMAASFPDRVGGGDRSLHGKPLIQSQFSLSSVSNQS